MDISNTIMYIPYYRVSTKKQGRSGLGLEGQKEIVERFILNSFGQILAEFTEVESGKSRSRPELLKAVELSKNNKAILIVAKLDRLSRDAEFAFMVSNRAHDIICCDMPDANKLMFGIMAVLAEYERKLISERTKAAYKAKLARGYVPICKNPFNEEHRKKSIFVRQKNAKDNDHFRQARAIIQEMNGTLEQKAVRLNELNFKTINGKPFRKETVRRLLKTI